MSKELVVEYLTIEDTIKALEAEQQSIKDRLSEALGDKEPGQTWEYDGVGSVAFVKGRVSKKLDPKKLMLSGVTAAIIKECTVESEPGSPHLRVSGWKPEA